MRVNLICIGKIKEKYIKDGIEEYSKRLRCYANVKTIELKESGNDKNRDISLKQEGEEIIKILEKEGGYNILLDLDGKKMDSVGMAKKIEEIGVNGNSKINFIIGGSYGVSNEIKQMCKLRLQFSDFTFPHQLMRLIFFEQLYRWFSIINNGKYHK